MYATVSQNKVAVSPESAQAADIFEQFLAAGTFKSALHHFRHICEVLRLRPTNFRNFYPKLKSKLKSWKATALWSKFDKRASHKCYSHGKICTNTKILIIGGGPCGLRSAIEAQLCGAKVVVVEKRDRFSRNNVLHLWPFVISDLKALGAKKFYGKFCAGAIDHISIRQLQCILLKVALILGVEIFECVTFEGLVEPPEDQSEKIGWRARFSPPDHPVNQYEFGVLIGADGKRNTLTGFKRKEFRGKLAIAITANFINRHTEAEARVQEISGVAFIFNQKFFKDLYAATGIDLENIVYYKDETHYFVMTAKKHSLINKGVILNDYPDTSQLLHAENVDRNALLSYAREAANFSTNYQLPQLDFAVNHYGKPDIAMFDFTSMFAAENACRVVERRNHKLLMGLVGDSLLEPFWPTGSGCARGFLSSFDTCWMIRSWASGKMTTLEVLAERESIYRLLAQTTPENLNKDHSSYSLEPSSRYPTINTRTVLAFQVRNLYDTDNPSNIEEAINPSYVINEELPKKRKWRDGVHADTLLSWCKKQVALYTDIHIHNMTSSFKDGRALCAIIHRYRPDLIDFASLKGEDIASNNQLAFDILEREFGVPPVMTGSEMAECDIPDKLSMISYISQIYDVFRGEIPHYKHPKMDDTEMALERSQVIRRSTPHVNILKNLTNKNTAPVTSVPGNISINKKRQTLERVDKRHLVENVGLGHDTICDEDGSLGERRMDSLKKNKKRRSDKAPNLQEKHDVANHGDYRRPQVEESQEFSDKKKGLEAKFKGTSYQATERKPKDMIRAIGKIEKSDWNMVALEKRAQDHAEGSQDRGERERVPKWNKDTFDEKFTHMERRLRENGEDEETIAKYKEIDASLRKLERKLREGSTLEAGIRGQNKVTNLANQLSGKFEKKEPEQVLIRRQPSATQITLPTSGSDLCHFCGNRVYLVERLSAEGKFFHRQCFKCDYCGANLRLGNYVYDREGRFGGKFFCVPHFGLTPRFARSRRADDADSAKENVVPNTKTATSTRSREPIGLVTATVKESVESAGRSQPVLPASALATTDSLYEKPSSAAVQSPASTTAKSTPASTPTLSLPPPQLRGTTPERVEFENSLVEQSDEEYLSEDEWTDRNFGASANELDDTSDDEDSDYSDLSDEEVEGEEMEFIEGGGTLTADQTRRLAESWRRRYSTDNLDDYDNDEVGKKLYHDSESDLDSDGMSEEYCAEGDESHTATEGEGCEDEDDEEDCEQVKRAREIRRQEVNINVCAPPRKAETSDSGSETEVASDEESEDSDTQIDTDSEFAEDPPPPSEIPKIVINESNDPAVDHEGTGKSSKKPGESSGITGKEKASLPQDQYIEQKVDLGTCQTESNDRVRDGPEKSASMTNLPDKSRINPHTEQLKRLFQRTESTEAIAAKKSLELKKQYLLGNNPMSPKKSVSTADLGDRFKSFMNKISETQKMLNPAPQPSASMQAYMNSAQKPPVSSPSSPLLPLRSVSLPQGSSDSSKDTEISSAKENKKESITTPVESSVFPVNESPSIKPCTEAKEDNLKEIEVEKKEKKKEEEQVEEEEEEEEVEHLGSFPVVLDKLACKDLLNQSPQVQKGVIEVENSKSESSGHTSETASDYDNVPSTHKRSVSKPSVASPSAVQPEDESPVVLQSSLSISLVNQTTLDVKVAEVKENEVPNDKVAVVTKELEVNQHPNGIDLCEDFGVSESPDNGIEAVNKELVMVNAPRSFECQTFEELEGAKEEPAKELGDVVSNSFNISADEDLSFVDEKFEELYSDAMVQSNELASKSDLGESISNKDSTKEVSNFSNKVTGDLDFSKSPSVSDVVMCSDLTESPKDLESDVSHKSPKKELSSPESKEAHLTETELSDWAGDNVGIFSAGEDIDTDLRHFKLKKQNVKGPVARIASMESLGDTDSAISTATSGPTKTGSSLLKPTVLGNLDGIEFMDTSDSATSSDEAPHRKQGYRKLGEETPTTPVAPQILSVPEDQCKIVFQDSEEKDSLEAKTSDDTSTELENSRNNSVNESVNNNDSLKGRKPKWGVKNDKNDAAPQTIGTSEPPSSSEPEIKQDLEGRLDSLDDYMSPKRYEGYIPRFRDRMSPFGLARDSIDVKKNSAKKPLFTPSKMDIAERKKNELELQKQLISHDTSTKKSPSPDSSTNQVTDRLKKKGQDGDVVRDMVMSRLSRKTPEKTGRRGSRTSISPLPSTGSRTSLFSPQSSQENLLERDSSTITPSEESSVMNGEVQSIASAPESQNTSKSGIFGVSKGDEKQAGSRLDINEKGKEISSCSDGTMSLSQPGVSESSISFGDNSSEVFKTETEPIVMKTYFNKDQTPITKSSSVVNEPENSVPDNFKSNLPATPLTHPEKFQNNNNSHLKQQLFKPYPAPTAQTQVVTCHTPVPHTPASSIRQEVEAEMASSVNRENAREAARHKARLMSDKDLGLSPPDLAENLREKLRRGSESEGGGDKEDKVKERIEEYRQKCQEGVRPTETEKRERIVRRHPHRPSLLQLESLQVFTSPEKHSTASNITSTSSTSLGNVSTMAVSPLHQIGGSSSNAHVEKSKSHQHLPLQTESMDPKGIDNRVEFWKQESMTPDKPPQDGAKKSGKKSKDRERRRSLIQVFAGMFGKSEDKKKSNSQSTGDAAETSTMSNSQGRLSSTSTEAISAPKQSNIPPKSPATVREKLAKLRLSRTKEKNKALKKRSSSADVVDGSVNSEWNRSALSLPTSPSHHPHSAQSSFYSQQQDAAPHASENTGNSALLLTTPRIEEESLSDDDGASASCTPGATLERTGTSTLASGGGSISKRQRAFRKAARQAELKRLRMAQEIQRQLEECEVKTRELEEKGVNVEKGLRGEPGFSGLDETELMSEWFSLVHEKNALIRWEQELMVRAKELELEDRHVRLEQELRERMALSEHDKSRQDIDREGIILAEMLSILEQKDALVQMQEEDRLRCDSSPVTLSDIKGTSWFHGQTNKSNTLDSKDPADGPCTPQCSYSPIPLIIPALSRQSSRVNVSKVQSNMISFEKLAARLTTITFCHNTRRHSSVHSVPVLQRNFRNSTRRVTLGSTAPFAHTLSKSHQTKSHILANDKRKRMQYKSLTLADLTPSRLCNSTNCVPALSYDKISTAVRPLIKDNSSNQTCCMNMLNGICIVVVMVLILAAIAVFWGFVFQHKPKGPQPF